jgi:hypothetical protein
MSKLILPQKLLIFVLLMLPVYTQYGVYYSFLQVAGKIFIPLAGHSLALTCNPITDPGVSLRTYPS